jgi:tetratricopeptide (TPR) repeat protein
MHGITAMNKRNLLLLAVLATLISFMQAANARRHDQPETFVANGNSLMQSGRYLQAQGEYSKAIKLDKKNPALYQMRANAEMSDSKFKPAISDLTKAIKFSPDDPNSYLVRAGAYDALKDFPKEKADLDKLIALQPNSAPALLQRARTNAQMKRMKDVIEDCNHAFDMGLDRQQLGQLYQLRATAYKKLGKKTEAQRELAKYESMQ